MIIITIDAGNADEAIKICQTQYGWTPDAVREVDSGKSATGAFMCFESAADAELWDKQK